MKKRKSKCLFLVIVLGFILLAGYWVTRNSNSSLNGRKFIENNIIEDEINLGDCSTECAYLRGNSAYNACINACQTRNKNNSSGKNNGKSSNSNNNNNNSSSNTPSATSAPSPVDCPKGQEHTMGHLYDQSDCRDIRITSVSTSSSGKYFTPSEATGVFSNISHQPSNAPANYSISGNGYVLSGSNVIFSNPTKGTGTSCATNNVTVTAKNSTNSVNTSNSACVYCSDWKTTSGYWKASGKTNFSSRYSVSGCDFYSEYNSDGYGRGYYKKWHGRCCGVGAPKQDYGYCYGDQPYIGIASSVKFIYGPPGSGNSSHPYIYKDIVNESDCTLMENANSCTTRTVNESEKELVATKCEDTVTFETNNWSKACGTGGSSYYTIGCTTKVTANFDADDNLVNTNYTLNKGQGFKLNIGVVEKITCNATFNSNLWSSSYEKVMKKFAKVVSRGGAKETAYDAYKKNNDSYFESFVDNLQVNDGGDWHKASKATRSEIFELHRLARELENIITEYNAFKIPQDTATESSLRMEYSSNKSNSKTAYNYVFESDKQECSPVKNVKKTHSSVTSNNMRGAKWLTAPKDYTEIYQKVVNLYPKNASINKVNGSAIYDNVNNNIVVLDGGNKIYLDNNADAQTIPLKLEITGLARNGSKISNNKCSVKVVDRDLLYRSVDLTNPFINSSWKKGENWINSLYDFTGTIHANTWSKGSMYSIDLSKETIDAIKESNRNNNSSSPYLGLCDSQNSSIQDSITRYLCNQIK